MNFRKILLNFPVSSQADFNEGADQATKGYFYNIENQNAE
jgi:hypothetical protein